MRAGDGGPISDLDWLPLLIVSHGTSNSCRNVHGINDISDIRYVELSRSHRNGAHAQSPAAETRSEANDLAAIRSASLGRPLLKPPASPSGHQSSKPRQENVPTTR